MAKKKPRTPQRDAKPNQGRESQPGEDSGPESTLRDSQALGTPDEGHRRGPAETDRIRSNLGPAERSELRRHVVNLTAGEFSEDGEFTTSREDVTAIFTEHLPEWAEQYQGDAPLRIVLFAHGGLVSESDGLAIAQKHIRWWRQNRVYPIYFVWETGFWQSIWQLLSGATREAAATRDFLGDARDRIIEGVARQLGGGLLWGGMKRSAERSFEPIGAGRVVVDLLHQFCQTRDEGDVELHAVGHSAGSIFLAHGLDYAVRQGLPAIKSLHFLAPAINVRLFKQKTLGLLGSGVEHLTIYTMLRSYELDDTVGPYGRSLLYLLYYALEDVRETDILGLEESLRRDAQVARALGLGTTSAAPNGDVVWSVSTQTEGRRASRSTTHGGFDDDVATMHSVLRRIKRLEDTAAVEPFRPSGRSVAPPGELATVSSPASGTMSVSQAGIQGRSGDRPAARRALCIGINSYPDAPLSGCVADAQRWHEWFLSAGFQVEPLLLDDDATRQRILESIRQLIGSSRAGDVLAIQYSGHGTQLPDLDGDEAQGDTPDFDEALVPVDHRQNGFVIDDDLADVCRTIPTGVNVTFLMDCCHSGTNTRLFVGSQSRPATDAKKRYLPADAQMIATHRKVRAASHPLGTRSPARRSANERTGEVLVSACRSDQVAWESQGQGDFTRQALQVLRTGVSGLSNAAFVERLAASFGTSARQTPQLWTADRLRDQPFLGASPEAPAAPVPPADLPSHDNDLRRILRELRDALNQVSL